MLPAALAVVALALGFIGFWRFGRTESPHWSFWDTVYRTFQLFTMEGASAPKISPLTLNVARFLAPAVSVWAVVLTVGTLLHTSYQGWLLRHRKGHVLVCGLGERGEQIAREFLDAGLRVAAIEIDHANARAEGLRERKCVVITGDASDPHVLKDAGIGKASHVVVVCSDDGTNVETALRAAEIIHQESGEANITAHIHDPELRDLLEAREKASTSQRTPIEWFNVPDRGARAMLDRVPMARPGKAPHIVVVGLGKLGRSLVRQAAERWRSEPGSEVLTVAAIDANAVGKVEGLKLRYAELARDVRCEIIPFQMEKNSPDFERGAFLRDRDGNICVDAVYVCPDDDVHGAVMAYSIHLHTKEAGVPIAVRMSGSSGLTSLLGAKTDSLFAQIMPIDVLGLTSQLEALLGPRGDG